MENRDCPLCVDLDGTLVRTDTLVETALLLVKKNPFNILFLFLWLLQGKAQLKHKIAEKVQLNASLLPYNEEVLNLIQEEKKKGREIWLCTAANKKIANAVADHVGLFDKVLSSDDSVNLSSGKKAQKLATEIGEKKFDYIGNSNDDLKVWDKARNALIVDLPGKLVKKVSAPVVVKIDSPKATPKVWLKQLRIHQWAKNMLIFVPFIAAHQFTDFISLNKSILAFFAFSLCASSVYILNDLLDLEADRKHVKKKFRPLASGKISLISGAIMTVVLLLASALLCLFLPVEFTATLAIYYILTLLYSFWLKRKMVFDVATLSLLYSIRILAGGAATNIILSNWLISFSMFIFFSLAIIKRVVELRCAEEDNVKLAGRGYTPMDLPILVAAGVSSGYISILVFTLYIESVRLIADKDNYEFLYFISPLLFIWLTRIWLLTWRDEMHDDPVAFALKDNASRMIGALILVIFVISSGILQ